MKSRSYSQKSDRQRTSAVQTLECRNLLAGDAAAVMFEFSVVSEDSIPDDPERGRSLVPPPSMHQTHEWDRFSVEVWVRGEGPEAVEVQDLKLDLGYRSDLTSAVGVEFGRSFDGEGSFQIDDATGEVRQIHGSSAGVTLSDADRVLFARVHFQAVPQLGDNVKLDRETGSVGPYSVELSTQNLSATSSGLEITAESASMPEMSLFPVIYDLNDDQRIGLADFAAFISHFGEMASSPEDGGSWFADFDKSRIVGLTDISYMISNYGKNYTDEAIAFPENYPDAWELPPPSGDDGGNGTVIITDPDGDKGNPPNPPPPPPQFDLNLFQFGIILPGTNEVFQLMIGGINWVNGIEIDRLTGSASLSDESGDDPGEVVLSIVLEDEEVYETEIELILDGELLDTVAELDQYSQLITTYVAEVMDSVKVMLAEALDDE